MTSIALRNLGETIRLHAESLLSGASEAASIELRHLATQAAQASPGPSAKTRANDAVRRYLPDLLAGPICRPLAAVWDQLDWHYHYPDRDDSPGLGSRIAFAELIGPAALLRAENIRAGFTFLAPDVLYPSHAHPAHELYVVLAGRALWTQSGTATWQDPGAVIVHASEEPHTMQSFTEPLLALYSWRGDLDSPARYV